jgi:hypothetical protein
MKSRSGAAGGDGSKQTTRRYEVITISIYIKKSKSKVKLSL